MNEKNSFDINFGLLFYNIISRLWLIILSAVILAGITYSYVAFFVKPVYSSTATLYIGSSNGPATIGDVNISDSLAKDYEVIIRRRKILDEVVRRLDLDMTAGQLRQCVSVSNVSNTRILDITVTTPDPARSKEIADTICIVASDELVSIIKDDYVSIVDVGNISSSPSNINMPVSMILAALLGIFLSVLYIMIRTFADDKLRTAEDIERWLGLSVIGTMPYAKEFDNAMSGVRKKRSKKRSDSGT
ncbi:MAG: hypothetical protein E7578_03580 [Ruminococcaceae bacterium]|nr:hypothetical protein [Oscillospiraceae bacterium]